MLRLAFCRNWKDLCVFCNSEEGVESRLELRIGPIWPFGRTNCLQDVPKDRAVGLMMLRVTSLLELLANLGSVVFKIRDPLIVLRHTLLAVVLYALLPPRMNLFAKSMPSLDLRTSLKASAPEIVWGRILDEWGQK